MSVRLRVREQEAVTVVAVFGDVVSDENGQVFRECFLRLLAQGKRCFLVDLTSVGRLGNIGVGELVLAYTTIVNRGGECKLLDTSGKFADLPHYKFCMVWPAFQNEEAAMESFSQECGKGLPH